MVLMAIYFASFGLSGTAATVASYVPIASVISMPARILAGEAAWWEPVLALAIMAAFAYGVMLVGARIYRRSLMQTRGKLSWREGLRAGE
jgi:ABC-2 type transport system permease protein